MYRFELIIGDCSTKILSMATPIGNSDCWCLFGQPVPFFMFEGPRPRIKFDEAEKIPQQSVDFGSKLLGLQFIIPSHVITSLKANSTGVSCVMHSILGEFDVFSLDWDGSPFSTRKAWQVFSKKCSAFLLDLRVGFLNICNQCFEACNKLHVCLSQ